MQGRGIRQGPAPRGEAHCGATRTGKRRKQRLGPKAVWSSMSWKTGAGEGIRTLYPNLGKRDKRLNMRDMMVVFQIFM